jgi:hypothetical protein
MFELLLRTFTWMFVVGMVGCFFLVIPITAYRLFSVLFERDSPDESEPTRQQL